MQITLQDTGKKYMHEWVFRSMTYLFEPGKHYAIKGPNGSGKSTLMQVLSGFLSPSSGTISFQHEGREIKPEQVYQLVGLASPYTELIEELNLDETIAFHQQFKPLLAGFDAERFKDILALPKSAASKELRFFSSGMRQRVKLGLAILSDTPLVLLDEPTVTLDASAADWYHQLIEQHMPKSRMLIVASNVPEDYRSCDAMLDMFDWKTKR